MKKGVSKKNNYVPVVKKDTIPAPNYAAIDLGTNSCRLVIATPTPTSFHVVETFSKININPKYKPQIIKFQAAPCHTPVNIQTIKIFLNHLILLTLFPPSGIYT